MFNELYWSIFSHLFKNKILNYMSTNIIFCVFYLISLCFFDKQNCDVIFITLLASFYLTEISFLLYISKKIYDFSKSDLFNKIVEELYKMEGDKDD